MENLTSTEMKIYGLVKAGKTNEEIIEDLYISKHTLKCYLSSISKKLKNK